MDAGQVVSNMNLAAVKEPRGFIRFLQVILAIFAFATTCSVSTSVQFKVTCLNDTSTAKTVKVPFSYPFGINSITFLVPTCSGSEPITFDSNPSSSAQFFVAIGVLAFLYSLGAIVLYVFFDQLYRKENKIIIADFLITAVFAVFWLISAAAWAKGLSDLKYFTNPNTGIFPLAKACDPQAKLADCESLSQGDFSSLNVSIIFGFLNMLVWGGNLWFLFKETPWFKGDSSSNYNPDSGMPQGTVGGSPTMPSTT